jgi:hypothetical protein
VLDLTNYEMLELANSHVANGADDLNRLAAAVTAYLLVAYRAGKELTRFQVIIINVFFVTIATQASFGAIGEQSAAIRYWVAVLGAENFPVQKWTIMGYIAHILGGLGLFACLAFMWRVRHPKTE